MGARVKDNRSRLRFEIRADRRRELKRAGSTPALIQVQYSQELASLPPIGLNAVSESYTSILGIIDGIELLHEECTEMQRAVIQVIHTEEARDAQLHVVREAKLESVLERGHLHDAALHVDPHVRQLVERRAVEHHRSGRAERRAAQRAVHGRGVSVRHEEVGRAADGRDGAVAAGATCPAPGGPGRRHPAPAPPTGAPTACRPR